MKPLVLFLLLCFGTMHSSQAQFISNDGELHFAAGALISGATYGVVYATTKNKKKAFWYSLGAATLAGIVKEVIDSQKVNNRFDAGDALATSLGGLTVSLGLQLIIKGKDKKAKQMAGIALVN
ncbi:hypothetical protein [Tamlana sp. I1]|uniref:hypothetical protein n=1 Tax=Tamlana sp. I1 TaxID=2762061 RepID=UPI00188E0F9B|nr:hypothetical protein [Tamlana sp. I1]